MLGGSWGWSIIGLTVIVRLVLVPLTFKQVRSMQRMQQLAPRIKELQARYKEDKQRQSEEMMKLYRQEGVNPFSSCLPLVLQLPVFVSLYYALRENLRTDICGAQLAHHFGVASANLIPSGKLSSITCNAVAPHSAKFLVIPDVTAKASGAVLIGLILLYVGSQLATMRLSMAATTDPTQRRLMMFLPVVFVAFIFRFPAGLLVYWITSNLWQLGQQAIVRRRMPTPPPAPPAAVSTNGGEAKQRGGLIGALAGVGLGAGGSGGSSGGAAAAGPKTAPQGRPERTSRKRSGSSGDGGEGKGEGKAVAKPPARSPSGPPPSARRKKKRSGRRR